jgi:hypothetical protein
MTRLPALLVALAVLLAIPATAAARTPVSGGLKQTIVQSFAETNHLDVNSHQMSACFDVYTDGSYALVVGGANFKGHERWYRTGGLCDIKALYNGLQVWQPDSGILRHETSSGGYWKMLVQFDEITGGELRSHGVPVSVYENLTGGHKPFPG